MTGSTAATVVSTPATAFRDVLSAGLEFAARKLSGKTDDLTDKLNGIAEGALEDTTGGAKAQAAVGAVSAGLQGKNPVWGAIKGAWSGGGAKAKAAVVAAVVALVLLLVLSPVLLLLLVLSLLIVAAVVKVKSRS